MSEGFQRPLNVHLYRAIPQCLTGHDCLVNCVAADKMMKSKTVCSDSERTKEGCTCAHMTHFPLSSFEGKRTLGAEIGGCLQTQER